MVPHLAWCSTGQNKGGYQLKSQHFAFIKIISLFIEAGLIHFGIAYNWGSWGNIVPHFKALRQVRLELHHIDANGSSLTSACFQRNASCAYEFSHVWINHLQTYSTFQRHIQLCRHIKMFTDISKCLQTYQMFTDILKCLQTYQNVDRHILMFADSSKCWQTH